MVADKSKELENAANSDDRNDDDEAEENDVEDEEDVDVEDEEDVLHDIFEKFRKSDFSRLEKVSIPPL